MSNKIILHIGELEWQHKQTPSPELLAVLMAQLDYLKMIDACLVTRDVAYSKHKWFEYRDKPGKSLAQLLEQQICHCTMLQ